ncbi:MAG: hypothetical protein PHQ10_04630 [Dehalococcoidales bacterium]|nr:hypothetical protein [Dehalococcoidales bacterium]MDD5498677.1 hypothetical protein [Dehalococcoidales bacterium]
MENRHITEEWLIFLKNLFDIGLSDEVNLKVLEIVPMSDRCRALVVSMINHRFPKNEILACVDLITPSSSSGQVYIPDVSRNSVQNLHPKAMSKRDTKTRYWAFCEAVNQDGSHLVRYPSSTACWRAEIGDLKTTGYTGWANKSAVDSFKNAGWQIAFGDPNNKRRGMRVVRPSNAY